MHQSKGRKLKEGEIDWVNEMVVTDQNQHLRTGGHSLMAACPPQSSVSHLPCRSASYCSHRSLIQRLSKELSWEPTNARSGTRVPKLTIKPTQRGSLEIIAGPRPVGTERRKRPRVSTLWASQSSGIEKFRASLLVFYHLILVSPRGHDRISICGCHLRSFCNYCSNLPFFCPHKVNLCLLIANDM